MQKREEAVKKESEARMRIKGKRIKKELKGNRK
jgi:hypothetical protein